jgi:drug/metabolite transporter (DMT)-like permease
VVLTEVRSLLSARLGLDTMIAVFFAILSSVCFGTGDYVGGIAAKRADLIFLMLANQIAGSLSLLLVASLLTPFQLPGGDLMLAALAGASTAIGIPLLYKALAIGPMSIAAPVTALMAILLPVIYGMTFLGEMPKWLAVAGFALAGIAVFLLGGGDKILEVLKPASGASSNALRGFLYALGAGTCIATFYVAIKRCSPESGLWPLVAARAVALGAVGGVALRRQLTRPVLLPGARLAGLGLLSGVLDGIGNAFYLLAAHGGNLGIVATITSLYPATTILLARYVLGERISPAQAIGIGSALVAIVAIVLSLQGTG